MKARRPLRRRVARNDRRMAEVLEARTFLSAGDLDPTFGSGGVVFPSGFNFPAVSGANAVAFAPDGKLVVGGIARSDASSTTAVVARFNPDGSLDTTFDGDGKVILPRVVEATDAGAAAVQPDGKILFVTGRQIVRLNPDGSLDTTFALAGYRYLSQSIRSFDEILLQPDGRIVVASGGRDLRLERIGANGSSDASFFADPTPGVVNADDQVNDLALAPDGKILVALTGNPGGATQRGVVVRFDNSTSLDTSFDNDGIVELAPGPNSSALSVQVLSDGKVAVAGTTSDGFFFARLRVDGRTDPTYGTGGYVLTPNSAAGPAGALPSTAFREMEYAPDGKELAAGPAPEWPDANDAVVVRRFLTDGSLDASFGTGGERRTPVGTNPRTTDLAVGADGASAVAISGPVGGPTQFSAARYTASGQPDAAFNGGKVTTAFALPAAATQFNAVAEVAGGKTVAAGLIATEFGTYQALIARYNTDGSLDTSFGSGGWTTVNVPGVTSTRFIEMVVLPDGDILAAGIGSDPGNTPNSSVIVRFNPDGSRDLGFGVNGIASWRLTPTGRTDMYDLAVDATGRIFLAGTYIPTSGTTQFLVARFTPRGLLDTSFDGDGVATTNVGTDSDFANSVTILSDGGILLGGYALKAIDNQYAAWAFVKYRPDGSLDPNFGNQPGDPGLDIVDVAAGDQQAYDVIPRSNGGFYATGRVSTGGTGSPSDFAVGAFNANGSLDTSFGGGDGVATAGFADDPAFGDVLPLRFALGADGEFTVAGYVTTATGDINIAVMRFTGAGALDTTFGQNGRTITDLADGDFPTDLALFQDGRAVVSGTSAITGGPTRPVLLRYQADSVPGAAGVYVRGSTWTPAFMFYMEAQGLGDDAYGFRADGPGAGPAATILPWANIDQIVVRYASPPTGGGIPTPANVTLEGIRSDYTVTTVTQFDPQTFLLTLHRPLGNLPGGGENGDHVQLTIPGAGPAGTALELLLNILQGDVDRSGTVIASDASDLKRRFFRRTASPGSGDTAYTVFHDSSTRSRRFRRARRRLRHPSQGAYTP